MSFFLKGVIMTEAEIEEERGKKYGDFSLNMISATRIIEAMVSQSIQQKVKLPDNFAAMVMVNIKMIRECFSHDPDNGIDAYNYLQCSRRIADAEKSNP
jgi:hypothetical protein